MSKKYTTNFLEDTNGSTGSANQVLVSTATGIDWVDGSGSSIIGGPYLPLAGGTMTGVTQFNDHTNYGDQVYAKFGAAQDLQIFHNGSHSFVTNGTGDLNLSTSSGGLYLTQFKDDGDIILQCDDGSGGVSDYLTLDGSTTHVYFSNPGNVGIGTTNPGQNLHVDGGATGLNQGIPATTGTTQNGILRLTSGASTYGETLDFGMNVGPTYGWIQATNKDGLNTNYNLSLNPNAGNVGIGTTSPVNKLQIGSVGSTGYAGNEIAWGDGTRAGAIYINSTGSYLYAYSNQIFAPGSSERMRITSDGNVGIGTTNPLSRLHVLSREIGNGANKGIRIENYNGSKNYSIRTGVSGYENTSLAFYDETAGANRIVIETGGEVGIGSVQPTQKLHVAGNLRVTGAYYDSNNSPGTANQVLVSTASGTDWVDGSGSGIIGGPYLPLTAGSGNGLTGQLWFTGTTDASRKIFFTNAGSYAKGYMDAGSYGFQVSGSEKLTIDTSGNVGIGTASPAAKLDVINSHLSTMLRLSNTEANATIKYGAVLGRHYTNAEENVTGMLITSSSSVTGGSVSIGGGISDSNAVNEIKFYTAANNTTLTGSERMRVASNGNVGIGTTSPTAKLEVANGAGKFCVDSKTHSLTNAFTTCLTVNLDSHTGCYVTLTCFGDWGSHSAAAYRGEFFLQNGANGYAEPGIILRQDDNTSNGSDQIICQILDPTSTSNPKDFEIQIRTTATTGTTSFTGQLTYTVQGKFNSIT